MSCVCTTGVVAHRDLLDFEGEPTRLVDDCIELPREPVPTDGRRPRCNRGRVPQPCSACDSATIGSTADPDPLERADVEDLPPGDAQGAARSGCYTVTSFEVARCGCREGDRDVFSCDEVQLAVDALAFEQDDGRLTIAPVVDEPALEFEMRGSIDVDGSFLAGASSAVLSGEDAASGQQYQLARGSFVNDDEGEFTWTTRTQFVLEGESFDCDIVAEVAIARQ